MSSEYRKYRAREALLDARLRAQLGVISRNQALEAGLSPQGVTRRVESGVWERVLVGVYRHTMFPADEQQAALAAVLWAGADSLVSHHMAGVLWALNDIAAPKVHVWVPPSRPPQSAAGGAPWEHRVN